MADKEQIKKLLLSTNRVGVKNLIEHMELNGFFTSPASGKYHLCCEGGLAEHSMNVYEYSHKIAKKLLDEEEYEKMKDSITLVALLHDLGKMGDHKKSNYIPKMVRSKTKNKETGEYDIVQSEAEPFTTNSDLIYTEHESRSIWIAERFIALTEEEEIAILWHNGLYGNHKYEIQSREFKLYMIIHTADMWVSRFVEE